MLDKKRQIDSIKKHLSNFSDVWYPKNNCLDLGSYESLKNFLGGIKNKYCFQSDKKSKPAEIPYNFSIYHFIVYYSYSSKFPFIYKTDNTVFFGCFSGKKYNDLIISIPLYNSRKNALNDLKKFIHKLNIYNVLIRDIDDNFINILRNKNDFDFVVESLKELNYAVYDLDKTLNLSGNDFSNLRWHLNAFEKKNHKIEVVDLKDNIKPVIHLIGEWQKQTKENRDFSFIDTRSDKKAARFFGKVTNENTSNKYFLDFDDVLCSVLKIDDVVSSFNLGFPLGFFDKTKFFAHAVGICDLSISHLAEYAQYIFWQKIKKKGYRYVNDGPTWRDSLRVYKNKFKPYDMKRMYWAKIFVK
jgi:hypothetical protein